MLHPYASADIYYKNNLIGSLGSIHPKFLKKIDLKKPFHYFEVKIDLLPRNDLAKLNAPSIYPTSQRDFSFEVDKNISFEQIDDCIRESSKAFLLSSKIFDIYAGKNIPKGKKSIAFRVLWGSSKKTLSEDEINDEVKHIISGMQNKLNAILR